uniref:Uncharacterized protein n=1 Tax=Rhizophagus irregularis (strain DAOM 181602 / DAOM 197198 / MUCL 43194) TaxID=747089 RepID=U9TV50_RHIID
MYDAKVKKAYVYCAKGDRKFDTFSKWISYLQDRGYLKDIDQLFKSQLSHHSINCIYLSTSKYKPYWKVTSFVNAEDILSSIQEKVKPGGEFSGTAIRKISEGTQLRYCVIDQRSSHRLI